MKNAGSETTAIDSIDPLTRQEARELTGWRYPPPYQIYSLSPKYLSALLKPEFRYHAVKNQSGELIAFCCFGADARVQGGNYRRGEPEVIDLGVGLRPDLTGKGLGKVVIREVMEFALKTYRPKSLRVTIAEFNIRSIRAFQSCGFTRTHRFIRSGGDRAFLQLEKD